MLWPPSTIGAIDDAAAAARAGTPTVLAVRAEAGFGKSTLLRAAVCRLDGFRVLRAFGEESSQDERFQLLTAWHAAGELVADVPRHTTQATRQLTGLVEAEQRCGPVALVVDDLQWIDRESVESLGSVVERAAGDRLLVLVAHRPLGTRHRAWRRLSPPAVVLDGLDADAAAALVASVDPAAPAALAEALRTHTGGSPLHIRALLQEHTASTLATLALRGELPAPADLAAAVGARLAELAPDAAQLLHALAVLGDTWTDAPTAAAVGAVADVDAAVEVLAGEGLVRLDRTAAVPRLRIVHAVVRAAVYETVPVVARRELHRVAAARLTGAGDRLRHRLAAAVGPDEGLAAELERHADDLRTRSFDREAGRFRRLAAASTADATVRERRLLDADLDSIVAREIGEVSVTGLDGDAGPLRRFVYALRLSATRRWVESARVLDGLDPDALDPVNAYRARVLRGWTIIGSGRPPVTALAPLEAAASSSVQDARFHNLFVMSYGQARSAAAEPDDPAWGVEEIRDVDRAELARTPDGLLRMQWRGTTAAVAGATDTAVGDLTVITQRINEGTLDTDDGVSQAFLAFAQCCRGEWRRASISVGLAQAAAHGMPQHPLVLATEPLTTLATGDDPGPLLARSRAARIAGPAPTFIRIGDVVEVAVLAFTGTPPERREWRARRTADFGPPTVPTTGRIPPVWLLAMGIAAAWADDDEATDVWAAALESRQTTEWRANAAAWLRALATRLRGRPAPFGDIAAAGLPGLGTFEGLLWVDAANETADPEVRHQAESALVQLGAGRYAATLLSLGSLQDDPLAVLSDREREVATLVLEGLSYAQIAKELFVTRSTVAFHLSNVYAKTSTSSRHEFVQLLRHLAVA